MTGNLKKPGNSFSARPVGLSRFSREREPRGCGTWVCVRAHVQTRYARAYTHTQGERDVQERALVTMQAGMSIISRELLLVSEGASLPLMGGQSLVRFDPSADWMRPTHFREGNCSTFTQSLPVQMFISPHHTVLETSRIMCDQVSGYGGLVKLTHRLYCPMQCARLGTLPESIQNQAGVALSFI